MGETVWFYCCHDRLVLCNKNNSRAFPLFSGAGNRCAITDCILLGLCSLLSTQQSKGRPGLSASIPSTDDGGGELGNLQPATNRPGRIDRIRRVHCGLRTVLARSGVFACGCRFVAKQRKEQHYHCNERPTRRDLPRMDHGDSEERNGEWRQSLP